MRPKKFLLGAMRFRSQLGQRTKKGAPRPRPLQQPPAGGTIKQHKARRPTKGARNQVAALIVQELKALIAGFLESSYLTHKRLSIVSFRSYGFDSPGG